MHSKFFFYFIMQGSQPFSSMWQCKGIKRNPKLLHVCARESRNNCNRTINRPHKKRENHTQRFYVVRQTRLCLQKRTSTFIFWFPTWICHELHITSIYNTHFIIPQKITSYSTSDTIIKIPMTFNPLGQPKQESTKFFKKLQCFAWSRNRDQDQEKVSHGSTTNQVREEIITTIDQHFFVRNFPDNKDNFQS